MREGERDVELATETEEARELWVIQMHRWYMGLLRVLS